MVAEYPTRNTNRAYGFVYIDDGQQLTYSLRTDYKAHDSKSSRSIPASKDARSLETDSKKIHFRFWATETDINVNGCKCDKSK